MKLREMRQRRPIPALTILQAGQIVEYADLRRRLPTQLVFDHLGNPTLPAGIEHLSHRIIRSLVNKGQAWVKLSGACLILFFLCVLCVPRVEVFDLPRVLRVEPNNDGVNL